MFYYKNYHKNDEIKFKKFKNSKSLVVCCDASVSMIKTASTMVVCKNRDQESNCGPNIQINDPVITLSNELLCKESIPAINNEEHTFKGFFDSDLIQCEHYYQEFN